MDEARKEQARDLIFALDIGTRSIIGVVGRLEGERVNVLAVEKQEHGKRAMIDGQIEDISQVSRVAAEVTARLEKRLDCRLERVCIAAAGRALRTEDGHFELQLPTVTRISDELIGQLEAGAVSAAEHTLHGEGDQDGRFYLVGYTVSRYLLDNYPISTLRDHNGRKLEVDVVATFLPSEVVESLYAAMHAAKLEVVSLTLEPIAAINAAIPAELRLLNLVMADIGAGTSDIAACRDGSVVGYTMATIAGDEITETIMRTYLVDFKTAEQIKAGLGEVETFQFTDILGMEQEIPAREVAEAVQPSIKQLAEELSHRILEINGGAPSAVFLAGGGSKLEGLLPEVASALGMDLRRVAVAGSNFKVSAFSNTEKLEDPEYTTPLGIAVSAGLGLISDSYRVTLNGQPAKLFRSGVLTALDVLLMNGFNYADMIGRTGQSLSVTVDFKRTLFRGEAAVPCVLLINGEERPPSTVVETGDVIEFTPARSGKSGARTLAEALGSREAAQAALVNGMPADPDYALRSGDSVETNAIVPLRTELAGDTAVIGADAPDKEQSQPEDAPQIAEDPQPEAENAAQSAQQLKAESAAQLAETAHPETEGAQAPVQAAPAREIVLGPTDTLEGMLAQSEDDESDEWLVETVLSSERPAPPPAPQGPVVPHSYFLNGEPLELPGKSDGLPYYLMDLLDYSGLDFKNLEKPVKLLVNGQEAPFMHPLADGDAVTIRMDE